MTPSDRPATKRGSILGIAGRIAARRHQDPCECWKPGMLDIVIDARPGPVPGLVAGTCAKCGAGGVVA